MATLDATTLAEYTAEVNAADRAQVVVDALTSTVYGRVYDSEGNLMGGGTMASPWATVSGDQVIPSTLNGFYVSSAGSVNTGWYFRFESGSRYVRLSFGLSGSGAEAEWSLSTWDLGTQAGIISGAITVTGNHAPEWTGAPVEITFSQGVGGTYDFSAVAADEDDDQLTYSLVGATYTGISIAPLTGVLTVTSAATAATRNLTVRVTDQDGLYADHAVAVSITNQASSLKWYPGHYAAPDAALTPSKLSEHSTLWAQIASVSNILGGAVLVPWGQVETAQGVYDWSAVDTQRNALAASGKKLAIAVKFENYTSSPLPTASANTANVNRIFPSYAITAGHVTAARNADGTYKGRQELKYWNAAAVDRMLAFITALAAKYDGDESVVLVASPETSIETDDLDATSTWPNAVTQFRRILLHLVASFTRTPVIFLNNFLQTQTVTTSFQQEVIDAGAGAGGPDLFIPSLETSDNWGMRVTRGARWNGTTWVEGVAENQSYKVAVSVDQQVVRRMAATPALYYDAARNRYDSTHLIWWAKPVCYEYNYAGDPAHRIPAMDWVNVLSYINSNSLPLRTTIPTSLA